MSRQEFPPLTGDQGEHFLRHGYLVIHDCPPRAFAEEGTANAFRRLGYSPDSPAPRQQEIVYIPAAWRLPMPEVAPKAWRPARALLGGQARCPAGKPGK